MKKTKNKLKIILFAFFIGASSTSGVFAIEIGEQVSSEINSSREDSIRSVTTETSFTTWFNKYNNQYVSHGIWEDNVDKVLDGGRLMSAEQVLREQMELSYEGTKSYGSRVKISLKDPALKRQIREVGPLISCKGLIYLKVRKEVDVDTYSILRKSESETWINLRTIRMNWEISDQSGDLEKSDMNLIWYLTEYQQDGNDLEIPLPNCSINSSILGLGKVLRDTNDYRIKFELYSNLLEDIRKRDQLFEIADREGISREALLIAHDEIHGRTTNLEIYQTSVLLAEAVSQFESKLIDRDLWPFMKSLGFSDQGYKYDSVQVFEQIRTGLYGGGKVQDTLSFTQNAVSLYGNVFVFIGNISKPSFGNIENTRHRPVLDFSRVIPEVRSPRPTLNEGVFGEVSLLDEDIIILGPRQILEKYKHKYKSKLVFTEDLSVNEKRLIRVIPNRGLLSDYKTLESITN